MAELQSLCICSLNRYMCSFAVQEEALKPFVSVLRLADSPAVRQRAVQSVAAALTAHPRGLGSGGTSVLMPRLTT